MTDEPFVRMIPLSKLVPSLANVRKTGRDVGIEELAASIASHGLLQNLTIRPVLNATGAETGKFEVVAGGRRLAALKLLAKRKAILKTYPVPCAFMPAFSGEEVSLAENVFQAPMHPADQYEAFARLHTEKGLGAEDIAARFGVTPAVVKQRLRLGAVSPFLMSIYRDGEMTLEQLMAFTITDDHELQERAWRELTWNKSKEMIRRLLTEGHVECSDRRVRFVGVEAYEAAGGYIVRDLFDAEHEGYCDSPDLLNRLVAEKLEREAEAVRAEGWKWVIVTPDFHYALASGMRRIYPEAVSLSEEDQAKLDALESEYEQLSMRYADENLSEEVAAQFERLEAEIETMRQERYRPEDIAICGAFVSLSTCGGLRVERGFLRPDDEPTKQVRESHTLAERYDEPSDVAGLEIDEDASDDTASLSDRLVTTLTAHRTAALRDRLAQNPQVALVALLHALCARTFYNAPNASCLMIELSSEALEMIESPAIEACAERTRAWGQRLPRDVADLWNYLSELSNDEVLSLLAVCVSSSVNAVKQPWERSAERLEAADHLAASLSLDMTGYWAPTVETYFGAVTKANIVEAVREGASEEAAERIAGMKKEPMAKAAEKVLKSSGWLPAVLRTPEIMRESATHVYALAAE
jgi:ParB family chromosome partitioning protein